MSANTAATVGPVKRSDFVLLRKLAEDERSMLMEILHREKVLQMRDVQKTGRLAAGNLEEWIQGSIQRRAKYMKMIKAFAAAGYPSNDHQRPNPSRLKP